MTDGRPTKDAPRRLPPWAWLGLLLLPVLGIGRGLLPGRVFLPQAPVAFEPLASEYPEEAAAAREGANAWTSDGLFPTWTEQEGFRRELSAGRWPLWDPNAGIGAPRLGTTMVGPLGPLGALGIAIGEKGAGGLALLRWLLFGAGMALWIRRAGGSARGALVGGLCAQAAGFLPMHLHHPMQVDALLPLPWMLAAVEGIRRRQRASAFLLALLSACSFLAGFPPIAVFVALTSAAYALLRWWTVDAEDGRSGIVGRAWTAILLGGAIASPQLLPTLEATSFSLRRPAEVARLADQAPPLPALGSTVHPHWLGDPRHPRDSTEDPLLHRLAPAGESHRADGIAPLEWNLHLGALAMALAVGALGRRRSLATPAHGPGNPHPPVALCLGLAVFTLAFSLALPPIHGLFALPGLDLGAPGRIHGITTVLVAGLAGWGWTRIEGSAGEGPRWGLLILGATVLWAGYVGFTTLDPEAWSSAEVRGLASRHAVEPAEVEGRIPRASWAEAASRLGRGAWVLLTLALFAGLVLLRRRPSLPALVVLLLAEGLWVAAPHRVPRDLGGAPILPASATMDRIAEATGGGRLLRLDRSADGLSEMLHLARPNLPQAYGISDLTPYTSLPDGRLTQLLEALDPESRFRSGASRISDPARLGSGILDLLNVTAVLALEPIEGLDSLEVVGREEAPRIDDRMAEDPPPFHIYRRPTALGPARLVSRGLRARSDRVALELLASGTVDPRGTTVLAPGCDLELPGGEPATPIPPGRGATPLPTPSFERSDPGILELEVELEAPAWLVVHEAAYPGWEAEVDGAPSPWARADHVAMAIPLGPGAHRVVLRYRPRSWSLGLGVGILGLLCATLLLRRSSPEVP